MESNNTHTDLLARIEELKLRLGEAEDTIDAIRSGTVDALIVNGTNGPELYTLKSADLTYRLFIEKMAEGAVTLNRNGLVLYSNSSFAQMLNLPLSDILGVDFEKLLPGEYKDAVKQAIEKAWGEEGQVEITLPGKTNTGIPVLLSLNTLEIDGGTALSIITTDLSFQKETLQQRKTIEQKDEFMSIASHELKTPVTSLKGYLQLLMLKFQQEGNMDAVEMLSKANHQTNKLTTLISDFLDVKKIEGGQLEYHVENFGFNDLVSEIVEETGRILHGQTINCQLDKDLKVSGDRSKLGQVITNFIENAGKYSSDDTPITVTTQNNAGSICLSVQDKGMGIPKEQQDRVFERFYRVKRKNENTYPGLGLGLYISAQIIKRHHGKIGLQSEPGYGSTFYFEVPAQYH